MATISVQVHPGAKKNEIARFQEGVWHIKIAAPPVEGKANKELIDFLSKKLDISKSRIIIEKGVRNRRKLIEVGGITEAEITTKLQIS